MLGKLFTSVLKIASFVTSKKVIYISNTYIMPTNLAVKSKYGFWYCGNVFDQQDIAYGVASNGTVEDFDTEVVYKILKDLKKDFVFYDVGANTGWYSMLASSINDTCTVHSFEPVQEHIDCLKESIYINKKINQTLVHDIALSDKKGEATILLAGTGSSLEKEFLDKNNGVRTIKTEKLDNVAKGILPPDFIKMDVEGHEYKVLLGAKETIEKSSPILFIEIADTLKNLKRSFIHPDFDKIFELFEKNNYISFILKNGTIKKFDALEKNNESYMFLFLHKEKHQRIIGKILR